MFSPDQLKELNAPLSRERVKTRVQGRSTLSYVEAWDCMAEANLIFGFDGWSRETTELRLVAEAGRPIGQDKVPGWGVSYISKVRVRVGTVVRDGTGVGHGIDRDLGQAHESAAKEAESDAMKRALSTFGNQFGLALYDKTQANVTDPNDATYQRFIESCKATIANAGPDFDLAQWFNSDAEKHKRADFGVTREDFDMLVKSIKAKLASRTS